MSKSAITMTNKTMRRTKRFAPVHPGEVILHDYIEPLAMSRYSLAKALGVTEARIGEIIRGRRSISPDTALRLARYFGTSPEFWMGMQAHYDLECARDSALAVIEREVQPRAA